MKEIILKRKYIIASLLINLCCVVIVNLISYPQYESDIDVMMQALIYGIYGEQVTSLVFSSFFIGEFIKIGIGVAPSLPWYTIFQYTCVFCSLFLMGCLFLEKNTGKLSKIIYSIFAIFVSYECYIRVGYLKTSSIVCIATIYLLFYILESKGKNRLFSLLVIIGFVLSSMISFTSFVITGILSLICLILYDSIYKRRYLLKRKMWIILILSLIGIISIRMTDNQIYKNNEWKAASKYKKSVEKLVAFGAEDYTEEIGKELGIDETKYNSLCRGVYISSDQEGLDLIYKISQINKEINIKNILGFFRSVPLSWFHIGMFFCYVILWGIVCFSKRERDRIIFTFTILILVGVYFWIFMMNAWDNLNIGPIIFGVLSVFALINYKEVKTADVNYAIVYLVVFSLILYNKFSYLFTTSVAQTELQYILEDREELYAVDLNKILKSYSAYVAYPQDFLNKENLLILNGNYAIFPNYKEITTASKQDVQNGIVCKDGRDIKEVFID